MGYDDHRFTSAVHEDLHCAICLNVLKDPMQCQKNEHHFCTPCIRRHLENFQACPSCMEELTLETLKKPSRFLRRNLSDLVIRCDYVTRGCPEVVPLPDLNTHLINCEFSPVQCSNVGCTDVINKRELMNHERQTCKFRKLRCDDCRETRKDIEEIKIRQKELQDQMSQVLTGINYLTQAVKTLNFQSSFKAKEDIIVAGGRNEHLRLNSAEIFTWTNREWIPLEPMAECRSGAASVVYENKVIITGGRGGRGDGHDSMEAIDFHDKCAEWFSVKPRLPCKLSTHKSLVFKDRLLIIGGCNNEEKTVSNGIYEIFLTPPYSSKLICLMSQPLCFHGAERFRTNIFIFGGSLAVENRQITDIVTKYDVDNNECTSMPALPFAIGGMATVSWQSNVIIIGGEGINKEALDTVLMYNIETGKCKMLPKMKYKRRGCTAVIVENMIVVMGGTDENVTYLNSVETFSFDRYCWEELPPMTKPRSYASAVVKFSNFS